MYIIYKYLWKLEENKLITFHISPSNHSKSTLKIFPCTIYRFFLVATTYVFFWRKSTSRVILQTHSLDPSKRNGLMSMSWLMDKVAHLRWSRENPMQYLGTSGLLSTAKMKCWPGPVQTSMYLLKRGALEAVMKKSQG